MPNENEAPETKEETFLTRIGLSEDEVEARLARYEELERESKRNRVDAKVRGWQEAKKAPAMVKAARTILLADEGAVVLNLSQEGGGAESLTASDIVDKMMSAAPALTLSEEPVTDEDATEENGPPPDDTEEENEEANLSQEVRALATSLFLDGSAPTEEKAVELARAQLEKK